MGCAGKVVEKIPTINARVVAVRKGGANGVVADGVYAGDGNAAAGRGGSGAGGGGEVAQAIESDGEGDAVREVDD